MKVVRRKEFGKKWKKEWKVKSWIKKNKKGWRMRYRHRYTFKVIGRKVGKLKSSLERKWVPYKYRIIYTNVVRVWTPLNGGDTERLTKDGLPYPIRRDRDIKVSSNRSFFSSSKVLLCATNPNRGRTVYLVTCNNLFDHRTSLNINLQSNTIVISLFNPHKITIIFPYPCEKFSRNIISVFTVQRLYSLTVLLLYPPFWTTKSIHPYFHVLRVTPLKHLL